MHCNFGNIIILPEHVEGGEKERVNESSKLTVRQIQINSTSSPSCEIK